MRKGPHHPGDRRGKHGNTPKGEKHWKAKLKAADVIAIRASEEPQDTIAAVYGIGQTTVSYIRAGKRWGWLKQPEQNHANPIP